MKNQKKKHKKENLKNKKNGKKIKNFQGIGTTFTKDLKTQKMCKF